mgnify:CR=1 FL=1
MKNTVIKNDNDQVSRWNSNNLNPNHLNHWNSDHEKCKCKNAIVESSKLLISDSCEWFIYQHSYEMDLIGYDSFAIV